MVAFQLTIDCANRDRLARFWAAALGYEPQDPPAGFATWRDFWLSRGVSEAEADDFSQIVDTIVDPAGGGPQIWFQEVPERKTIKNRLHLDIDASGRISGKVVSNEERRRKMRAEVERLTALGAVVAEQANDDGDWFVVMRDPEGNEFCVA